MCIAMKKKRNPSASELTEHELLLVEKTIAAIIAQDWEFISRVPKNALHNDENFREYVTIANLRSSDVPNNIADKIRVTITGSGEDMVQVLLRQTGGEHGVVLVFSRKHKTHDLRLHFLFSTDARPSAQPSEEAKDREGEIFAIAEERTRSLAPPTRRGGAASWSHSHLAAFEPLQSSNSNRRSNPSGGSKARKSGAPTAVGSPAAAVAEGVADLGSEKVDIPPHVPA